VDGALVNTKRLRINLLALGAQPPTMHAVREIAEAGGVLNPKTAKAIGLTIPDPFCCVRTR
jgi:hypothetical protein